MTTFTIDSTGLFTLVAIAAGVGFFVGLAMVVFRRGKTNQKPPQKGLLGVARIWRDKFDGQLWLQVADKSGSSLDDFTGDDRERVTKIANDLADWVERAVIIQTAGTTITPDFHDKAMGPPEAPLPAPIPVDAKPVEPLSGDQTVEPGPIPQPEKPSTVIYPAVQTPQAENRPRIDVVKGLRLTLEGNSASKLEKSQNRSIAAQVDEILQEKIKGTSLEQRAIRLMELPGKGMVVLVGMEQYDTLDAVPYPDVKAAIKYCVAQWEKKMLG